MKLRRIRFTGTTYSIGAPGSRHDVRGPTAAELETLDALVAGGARVRRVGPCEYEIAEPIGLAIGGAS